MISREEKWVESAFAYWGRAGQLLVNFPPVPSNSPRSLCGSQLTRPSSLLLSKVANNSLFGTVRKSTLAAFISYVDAEMPQ